MADLDGAAKAGRPASAFALCLLLLAWLAAGLAAAPVPSGRAADDLARIALAPVQGERTLVPVKGEPKPLPVLKRMGDGGDGKAPAPALPVLRTDIPAAEAPARAPAGPASGLPTAALASLPGARAPPTA
ncbi:MAG TPA: hypothetical protein VED40_16805 [Azospirillaceae bacterium]|nr:hypothetical protein [Azospirillaceae bacterium]